MSADDVKLLGLLEQENARLKKILEKRDLEIEVMKEIAAKKWWAHPPDDRAAGPHGSCP
jgi:putative transposase